MRGEPVSRFVGGTLPPLSLFFLTAYLMALCVANARAGEPLPPALLAPLAAALTAECGCDSVRAEWSGSATVSSDLAKLTAIEARLDPVPESEACSRDHRILRVTGQRDGKSRAYALRVDPYCYAPVLLAKRSLKRNTIVEESDFERVLCWVKPSAHSADVPTFPAFTQRTVGARAPLTQGDLLPPPLVRRGEPITVVLRGPSFVLHGQAAARVDAWSGDRIHVRLEGAAHDCEGRVTGPGQIEVQFAHGRPLGD